MRTFLLTGIPFGVFWGFYFGSGKGPASAVWYGIIAGFSGGFAGAVLARYRENRVSESGPALTDEMLLREGRATHDGVSGWLYLTNRRVLFNGYPTDENSPEITTLFERFPAGTTDAHQVSIPVLQISAVIPGSLGVYSDLDIVLTDGRTLYFGTEDPAEWVEEISTVRQKYLDEPRSEELKLFP